MKQKEYKPTRQEKSREEMAAIGTMILVTVVALILVINLIFNIIMAKQNKHRSSI
jgi:hypothetical protein